MISVPTRQPPWLRGDKPQPFVLTICTERPQNEILGRLQDEFADFRFERQRRLTAQACEATFTSDPDGAWRMWQALRSTYAAADVYLQPRAEFGKRLLICDMDMTMVAAETLDEVASMLNIGERVASITARAMRGEIRFDAALRERIQMLAGQSEQLFHAVAQVVPISPGAPDLLRAAKAAGVHSILVSGGFAQVAEPVSARLGFDEVYCNRLQLIDGKLTGSVLDPIVDADYKSQLLRRRARELGFDLADCCAIGDGANDVPMLSTAGLGIAYRAKPVLRDAAHCHIDVTDLTSAIHFMGLPADPAS